MNQWLPDFEFFAIPGVSKRCLFTTTPIEVPTEAVHLNVTEQLRLSGVIGIWMLGNAELVFCVKQPINEHRELYRYDQYETVDPNGFYIRELGTVFTDYLR